jgi:hypothetical protein
MGAISSFICGRQLRSTFIVNYVGVAEEIRLEGVGKAMAHASFKTIKAQLDNRCEN